MPRIAKGQPTPSDVHVDAPLTNMSIAYMQDQRNFVATRMFPVVSVPKQTNKYFTFNKNDFLRDEVRRRAPATESAGSGWRQSTDSYSCDVWALHKDLDKQMLANYDSPLNPQRNATQFLTQQMLIRQEVQFASDFFATSVWGTDTTPTILWSDATSDPRTDIDNAKRAILVSTGQEANRFALGYDLFNALKRHPDIRDQVKYTSDKTITPQLLAAIFEIDEVVVMKAIKATNSEGATTGTYDFVEGSRSGLLLHANPAPAIEMPSAGYTFMWDNEDSPSSGQGPWGITKWYNDDRKAWRVEIESAWDNKVTGSDLGVFFSLATAAVV